MPATWQKVGGCKSPGTWPDHVDEEAGRHRHREADQECGAGSGFDVRQEGMDRLAIS